MTEYELLEILNGLREGEQQEVPVDVSKAAHEIPKDLWKVLSAFSNTPGGGVMILGVDPQRSFNISGVRSAPDMKEALISLCSQMCPRLDPLIQIFRLEGKDVITVEAGEVLPHQKPCYYRGQGYFNGSYIRSGEGYRALSPYEIQSISECSSQPRYDAEALPGTTIKDVDGSLLNYFLERMRSRPGTPFSDWEKEDILEASHVLVRDKHGKQVLSLAGWLAFAPYPQKIFPSLCVTFLRFPTPVAGEPGPQGERFLDNVKIEGPLPDMVVHTMRAVKRNMQRRDVINGLFREEHWEYPEEAIREGIVNALGHRDYSPQARVSQVQILMFPDRIEIISPGGIYGPIIPDQLGEVGIQSSRNESMMNILENISSRGESRTLCENRGSGLAAVMVSCRKEKLSPPNFRVDLSRFRMILSNRTLFDSQTLEWLDNVSRGRTVTESQRYALAHLKHVGWINNADYCRLTGVDSRVATRELGDMVNSGLLDRLGSSRWSTYQLSSGYRNRQQTLF